MSTGVVYFLRSDRYVKIGWTTGDPRARIDALQNGNPIQLELIGAVAGDPFREAQLHRIASDAQVHGEWFDGEHAIIKLLIEAMSAGELWRTADSLGAKVAPKPRAILEACPHPAAQKLLSYIRTMHGTLPAFCSAHGLDRFLVARVLNGGITRYSVDFALDIQQATKGAISAGDWCVDDATRAAIEAFRASRKAA